MSIDEQSISVPHPPHSRFFFEAGTWRIMLIAAVALAAYIGYGMIHSYLMLQKHWPPLQPTDRGLTVLGLLDSADHAKYKAIEANHAWQVRRAQEEDEGGDTPDDKDAAVDRGNNPSQAHQAIKGRVVPVTELMKNLPTVLSGQNFTSAWVEDKYEPFRESHFFIVHVSLTEEGRSRYYQFSREHDGERLVFILNGPAGEISICPRMKHMDVGELEVEQFWVKADADKLADIINGKKQQ
jgi:hypothetical protein